MFLRIFYSSFVSGESAEKTFKYPFGSSYGNEAMITIKFGSVVDHQSKTKAIFFSSIPEMFFSTNLVTKYRYFKK